VLMSGILLGINQLSPNVFNDVYIIIASNEVGMFSLELSSATVPIPNASPGAQSAAVMGREQVRMEDLLQAQFENELNLLAFEGMATFSINMLIHQINKSESLGGEGVGLTPI
jgi:Ras GTPase-activating-like protein IQGAP2/3